MSGIDATTLALVKEHLVKTSTAEDALLTTLIRAVSAQVEAYLITPLFESERTEFYDAVEGAHDIWLLSVPVNGVSEARIDTTWAFATTSIISANLYRIDRATGRLYFSNSLPEGPGVVQVRYTGGLAATTADLVAKFPDVALAATQQVGELYRRRGNASATGRGGGQGGISYPKGLVLLDVVRELLDPHRRLVIS